jgi:hypothetical protein
MPFTFRADLISSACVIIWEELAGANIAVMEAVHDICCSIKNSTRPFGGIPFVGLGDFRQVAPVVKGQGVVPALLASVKSSYLWPTFRVLSLTYPHRSYQDPGYTMFFDTVGEDHDHPQITIPPLQRINSIDDAVNFLYPIDVLNNPYQCLRRAFLSPKNVDVDDFNENILDQLQGERCASHVHSSIINVLI